jgi:5-methylcytosine-specific restriction endonuclease McrA
MSQVFVVDTKKQPLQPVHPGRARLLLSSGKAAVLKRYPFTLILTTAIEEPHLHPLRLKLDPGSKTTGLALVNDASGEVVFAAELFHRGHAIKEALDARRVVRRNRRARHTRYRQARWHNRRRKPGWLPPSVESRVSNILTWVSRLRRLCPITALSMELVCFDTQAMEKPEITNKEYQQGTLAGYEAREYLLHKWKRACAYCGKQNVPLQIEHIQPRAKGGTDRISNLTVACEPCNAAKNTQDIRMFLAKKPDALKRLLAQAQAPLKDAAAVTTSRWNLYERLNALGLPVECGSGGLTKYNRTLRGLAKTHWCDAANVGQSTPEQLQVQGIRPLLITATGHGNRQMAGVKKGFQIRHRQRQKKHHGFQTGEMVRARVPKGVHAGTHVGRVLVRATGSFDIKTKHERIGGISAKYCHAIQHNDGYSYAEGGGNSSLA